MQTETNTYNFKKYLILTLVFILGFLAHGLIDGNFNSKTNAQEAGSNTKNFFPLLFKTNAVDPGLYEKVLSLLEEKHIKAKEISQESKIYGSIKGLTDSYSDPYTTFFPPSETKDFKTSVAGSFEGVGMEVGLKDGIITVIAPLKSSPAEKAGVKADDRIIKINATSTDKMSVEAAIKLIRGPKGTPVTITVFRLSDKTQKEITIIRDKIDIPTVDTKIIGNTFHLSLYSFNESSPIKFEAALNEFVRSGKKNLIIDLRNNPGGYLQAAVLMASFFTDKGQNIVTEDFVRTGVKNEHPSNGFNLVATDTKVVVLVNKGSASASEIFAGALQDYDRAKIIGEKSFGKGSVQEYIDLNGGTSIKITVANWLTPKGHIIDHNGVTPDIIIPFKENPKNKKLDNQVDTAIRVLNNWETYKKHKALENSSLDLGAVATTTKK